MAVEKVFSIMVSNLIENLPRTIVADDSKLFCTVEYFLNAITSNIAQLGVKR